MRVRTVLGLLGLALALPSPGLPGGEEAAREAEQRVHELRKEKRYKEALAYLDLAVKKSPESGNLRGLSCWIHLEDLNEPKKALDDALRLKQDLPKHRGGYYWSARAYEALGDYGKCIAALDDFRPYGRDFVQDNLKASCYYKGDQLEQAIQALPDEDRLGDNYSKYAGWPVWLRGQIARRKLFGEMKPKLRAQATAASARERTIALAKLALLGVPEGAELAELAGAADKGALKPVADNLRKELTAEPRFYRELEAPSLSEAKTVRPEEAFAEMWRTLDEPPRPGAIPAIAGKYLTKETLEMAKRFPAVAASPFTIQIDEAGGRYNFGGGWNRTDGEIDTSFEPGRWYSYSFVREGSLGIVMTALQSRWAQFVTTSYRQDGNDLVSPTRTWADGGDVFAVSDVVTRYLRVP